MPDIDLVIDALATARIARLITEDDLTEPIRDKVMGRWPQSKVSYLVTCPACTSVWAGAAVLVMRRSPYLRWVRRTLALSEASLAVRRLING